jgi:glyoxylase-like metal-dependent hydrolase (beta-lactamase superfamily II)/ferredoxin
VARLDSVNPLNADGDWFVDTRCIDCDTCRQLAPSVFVGVRGRAVVGAQPAPGSTGDRAASLASVACPTQSIGTRARRPFPVGGGGFPLEIAPATGVYQCGWNAESSYGAHSWLAARPGTPTGSSLVDSPRWSSRLAAEVRALGGIDRVLLTHQDDVADAGRWAAEFGAEVWIHADDARAAPFATHVVEGEDPVEVAPGLLCVPVPGHTRGSVVYVLEDRFLFSGDSLAWDAEDDDLVAWEDVCWWSWPAQLASLRKLAQVSSFEWVLPGHGHRSPAPLPTAEHRERLLALVTREAR